MKTRFKVNASVGVRVRSSLRAGRIFDTPSLKGSLQSASSALGLLLDLKRLGKCRALCSAPGLLERRSCVGRPS